MKHSHRSDPSNALNTGKTRLSEPQARAASEMTSTCNAQIAAQCNDTIEDMLERYNIQYISERARRTIQKFPLLQQLVEDIASDVYGSFWLRLERGAVENPGAYIGKMIYHRCIDHMRSIRNERSQFVQINSEEEWDMLENMYIATSSEGFRDPALEFEYKEAAEGCYRLAATAIAALPTRQKEASALRLLCEVDDPQLLLEQFIACQIALPKLPQGDKKEQHLLDASYNHAKKVLAKSLEVDSTQFKQKKRCHVPSLTIERMLAC